MNSAPPKQQKVKPRYITPPNILKQKAGSGGIDPERLKKAQGFMNDISFDFRPIAIEFMKQFETQTQIAFKEPENFNDLKDEIIKPVMQLKANGAMFKYSLISDVADSALRFLETLSMINKDAYSVLQAYQNTLNIIIDNTLTGSGGKEGLALVKELEKASARFFKKHKAEE